MKNTPTEDDDENDGNGSISDSFQASADTDARKVLVGNVLHYLAVLDEDTHALEQWLAYEKTQGKDAPAVIEALYKEIPVALRYPFLKLIHSNTRKYNITLPADPVHSTDISTLPQGLAAINHTYQLMDLKTRQQAPWIFIGGYALATEGTMILLDVIIGQKPTDPEQTLMIDCLAALLPGLFGGLAFLAAHIRPLKKLNRDSYFESNYIEQKTVDKKLTFSYLSDMGKDPGYIFAVMMVTLEALLVFVSTFGTVAVLADLVVCTAKDNEYSFNFWGEFFWQESWFDGDLAVLEYGLKGIMTLGDVVFSAIVAYNVARAHFAFDGVECRDCIREWLGKKL